MDEQYIDRQQRCHPTMVRLCTKAERVRLKALAKEFASLLAEAAKSASTPTAGEAAQGNSIPEPKHFWLVPVLHRLADIAERLEVCALLVDGFHCNPSRRLM